MTLHSPGFQKSLLTTLFLTTLKAVQCNHKYQCCYRHSVSSSLFPELFLNSGSVQYLVCFKCCVYFVMFLLLCPAPHLYVHLKGLLKMSPMSSSYHLSVVHKSFCIILYTKFACVSVCAQRRIQQSSELSVYLCINCGFQLPLCNINC